ncbi:hypothetical protein [Lysinibacillus xylanilyticus]|uniref:DUF8042 domain-containing protein n=1 Tax=Lysinibacillus xylanilyticus TaxID=582475 RepID=A0A2M9PZE3_9BACI|nr:hypothetical protein [Lysinibacillus xylanilyticus]PJO41199.1 hypothetical protein CWD94_23980 [Lysinibacillus xylanilyticus]
MEINELIESYNDYVKKIPGGAIYIANYLREDKLNDALIAIKAFSEGVLWLSQACDLLVKNGAEVALNIEQIQEFLIEVNDGLEKQDYVLVADMFEYEITPFFEEVVRAKGTVQ